MERGKETRERGRNKEESGPEVNGGHGEGTGVKEQEGR